MQKKDNIPVEPPDEKNEHASGKMTDKQKNSIIKTIEIRLEGVREVAKRSRFAFLIMIITCAAIFIAIWNAHFSWNRKSAFPADMTPETVDVYTGDKDKPCADIKMPDSDRKITSNDEEHPCHGFALPLSEYNRRNRALEWTKSTNVAIGLLGVTVHSNDMMIIGSGTILLISVWFVFSFRRENKTIVSLLRDVALDSKFIGKKKGGNEWDVANLAYQGIVNNIVYINADSKQKDAPMGEQEIKEAMREIVIESKSKKQENTKPPDMKKDTTDMSSTDTAKNNLFAVGSRNNKIIETVTKGARGGIYVGFFLPPIIILVIVSIDWYSLYMNSAYIEGFQRIGSRPGVYWEINKHTLFAALCFILSSFNCFSAYILAKRIGQALKYFKDWLDDPNPDENDLGREILFQDKS